MITVIMKQGLIYDYRFLHILRILCLLIDRMCTCMLQRSQPDDFVLLCMQIFVCSLTETLNDNYIIEICIAFVFVFFIGNNTVIKVSVQYRAGYTMIATIFPNEKNHIQ